MSAVATLPEPRVTGRPSRRPPGRRTPFVDELRKWQWQLDLTNQEFADKLGLSLPYLMKVLSGERLVSLTVVANVLELRPEMVRLLRGERAMSLGIVGRMAAERPDLLRYLAKAVAAEAAERAAQRAPSRSRRVAGRARAAIRDGAEARAS